MQAMSASLASAWPLLSEGVRLPFLRACCAVTEGADVPLPRAAPDGSSCCPPDVCVAVVLGDAERRVAVLGGREGMPRSLGSVYGGSVTRFLGGSLRGVVSHVVDTPGVKSGCSSVAVSRDGRTLLVSDTHGGSHAIHELNVVDGSRRRLIGSRGVGPLQFVCPSQVYIAPDDFVFVADFGSNRVQVLTPTLDFHGFVGADVLDKPVGVCANDDIVVVAELGDHGVSVFSRRDGTLLRRFGSLYTPLVSPNGLCFMSGDRHVAVAEWGNSRVSVFSVDGEFIRHVGVGVLLYPRSVACSAFDELVVADTGSRHLLVFSASGKLLKTMGSGYFAGVSVRDGALFTQDHDGGVNKCVVFT
jgi:DNA-binding beta-propeller fold protein YncE